MIAAAGKFLLAGVAGVIALIVAISAVTGRWPAIVTIANKLDDASCSLAFSDGFTWDVEVAKGKEKFWLFLLGKPESVDATCQVAGETITREHYFCYTDPDFTFTLSDQPSKNLCAVR